MTCPAVPRAILLATDLGPGCDRASARAALLAKRWDARLVAVTVASSPGAGELMREFLPLPAWARQESPQRRAERELRRDLAGLEVDATVVAATGETGPSLLEVAHSHGCDLIVTGPPGGGVSRAALQRGTVQWLARNARQPMLVVGSRVHGPYRRLALGIDFSPASGAAARLAASWFGDGAEHLAALHGIQPAARGGFGAQADTAPERAATPHIALSAALREGLDGVELPARLRDMASVIVEPMDPARLLCEYARSCEADLIAIGRKGRSALAHVLLGSVAERVLTAHAADVLLVGEDACAGGVSAPGG